MDNSTVACLFHAWNNQLCEGVSSVKMALERGIEVVQSVSKQGSTGWTSSVVDQNVNSTTLRKKNGDGGLDGGLVFKVQDKACMFTFSEAGQFVTKVGK